MLPCNLNPKAHSVGRKSAVMVCGDAACGLAFINVRYKDPKQMREVMMNEDVFNTSIRKFLKRLGVTAQREIEKTVRQGMAEGKLKGNERFPAEATVTLSGIGLSLEIKGEIDLDE